MSGRAYLVIILIFVTLVSVGLGTVQATSNQTVITANAVFLPIVFNNATSATPPPTPTSTPIPTNTPEPSMPQIEHTSLYVDFFNETHLLGEVFNSSSAPVYFPQVAVTFFNADGTIAGTGSTYTLANMIQPGELAPFEIISQPQAGWARDTLAVGCQVSGVFYSHAFSFSDQNQFSDQYEAHYTGLITNNSGQALQYPRVILTGYNGSGDVVVAAETYASAPNNGIAPGASAAYEVSVPLERNSLITSMVFQSEGSRYY